MGDLSEHFSRDEMACRCSDCRREGRRLELDPRLVPALEKVRALAGWPVKISSGYRCPRHPLTAERPGSTHPKGQAADLSVRGLEAPALFRIVEQVPEFAAGGIGVYRSDNPRQERVHVDVRTNGPARWGVINGRECSLAEALAWRRG